ncbi:MAG: class I SAM-dependent methyltransferase [Phycisphaerales bacterium]|nr:class I SAM-dependent methyltransferase [Phycisphaerales bacterium]
MPMTQDDIRAYYREQWQSANDARSQGVSNAMNYSSPIEDAVIYSIYERLISDLGIRMNNARVLDIGSGSGRWIRFILERYTPTSLTGIDFAESSVMLLKEWAASVETTSKVAFQTADITSEQLILDGHTDPFDTINVSNVLFHIPEPQKFEQSLRNIASLLADDGRVITTEYMPRTTMRTNWMAVRNRYDFENACFNAGLEIADIRASSFFSNDPMGIDGPDSTTRKRFNTVRALTQQLLDGVANDESRAFVTRLFAEIEHACIEYCSERIAQVDMPAQKLVVLRKR